MDASKTVVSESGIKFIPKPVVIHLSYPGGSDSSTNTTIESQCASVATDLQLLAPYRDAAGMTLGKMANTVKTVTYAFKKMINYIELLCKRTKLTISFLAICL